MRVVYNFTDVPWAFFVFAIYIEHLRYPGKPSGMRIILFSLFVSPLPTFLQSVLPQLANSASLVLAVDHLGGCPALGLYAKHTDCLDGYAPQRVIL